MVEVVTADGVDGAALAPAGAVRSGLRQHPARAAAAPRRAAPTADRARRPHRALRHCAAQANAVIAAYRPLALERRIDLDGWTTLVFVRRARTRIGVAGRVRGLIDCRACSKLNSNRSRIAATAARARRASQRCARNSRIAASTASSCRAPIAFRTNTCRPAPSGSPGSPASPARPASPSCLPSARCCSSTAVIRCRSREEVDSAIFSVEHLVEQSAAGLDRSQSAGRHEARLFAVAAHRRRRRAARQSLRGGRREPRAGRRQSDRRHLDRPAAAAARRGGAARSALCRRRRADQARARARGACKKSTADTLMVSRPARGVVAVQHPRQRCSAHAGRARLRHRAQGGPAALCIVDLRKLGNEIRIASGRDRRRARRTPRSNAILPRSARRIARRAARSRHLPRSDRAARRSTMAARSCAAPIRSRR